VDQKEIYAQKGYSLTTEDRLKLAELLIKAGCIVRFASVTLPGEKQKTKVVQFWVQTDTFSISHLPGDV
jgi:hypothetical protein